MDNKILTVKNLSVRLNNSLTSRPILDQIDLSIKQGETVGLVGESGSGKSMLALSIMRLLPPSVFLDPKSAIDLKHVDLLRIPESQMREHRGTDISMIFQEPMTSLNPVFTIKTQLVEAVKRSANKQDILVRTNELLELVELPDRTLMSYPHQLSGGQRQRVMIAMALASEPKLLIADEPTTALDVTIQAQILDLLKDIQEKMGLSILLITHDLAIVKQMTDKVYMLYAGKVVEEAPTDKFFPEPLHPYGEQLLKTLPSIDKRSKQLKVITGMVPALSEKLPGCIFAPRCQQAQSVCHHVYPEKTHLDDNHHVECHIYSNRIQKQDANQSSDDLVEKVSTDTKQALLSIKDLNVHYKLSKGMGGASKEVFKALNGVTLDVFPGETLAIVGESGCGKTTLAKTILRLIKPTSGEILYEGENLSRLNSRKKQLLRNDMQMIFQDPFASLNPRMMIREIIAEGLPPKFKGNSNDRISELLTQVGLSPETMSRYPHEFSGGQRQRIAIARALARNPKVLICDEPTSALDVSVQAQVLNLLRDLQQKLNLTYIFITHNIAVVSYFATRVAVMQKGRVVEIGDVQQIIQAPFHEYTKTLLEAVPEL